MLARTIWWDDDGETVAVIDQTRLPRELVVSRWHRLDDAEHGIASMQVRGAPLIGVAAAHGVALALAGDPGSLDEACERLAATRPTAVNLRWALDHVRDRLSCAPVHERASVARQLATEIADADVESCRRIGEAGGELIAAIHARTGQPVELLTHCNAGWLACVEWGTATAPVYLAHDHGVPVHVWVSETRPRNQGALTAWELAHRGVPHTLIVDSAAGHLLRMGAVDAVIVGADRVAANGDAANKIGTYLKALAARDCGVPFYVAVPRTTFDPSCPDGSSIPIEERDTAEVLTANDALVVPAGTDARNWAFDVTPARLITSYVTDGGVLTHDDLPGFLGA